MIDVPNLGGAWSKLGREGPQSKDEIGKACFVDDGAWRRSWIAESDLVASCCQFSANRNRSRQQTQVVGRQGRKEELLLHLYLDRRRPA